MGHAGACCSQDMARRGDRAQVLFLGTGCAEPSKYRGSSGVHVRLGSGRGLLLDAGEGAWGGLVRHYGPAQAQAEVGGHIFFLLACSPESGLHELRAILGLRGVLRAPNMTFQEASRGLPCACLPLCR